jgi:hypothetical protein
MPVDLLHRKHNKMPPGLIKELTEAAKEIDDCFVSSSNSKYQSFEDILDEK